MPIFHLAPSYHDTWVVFDRSLRVVDCGEHLEPLRRKHGARRTFCFVAGPGDSPQAAADGPWSLRGMLGHPPVGLAFG
ncbi:MAG: hypothetical protein NTY77_01195 [Elusimicrobia bacterium]|nr:hypothetical protein [Elusimicrobiota bacterium]